MIMPLHITKQRKKQTEAASERVTLRAMEAMTNAEDKCRAVMGKGKIP